MNAMQRLLTPSCLILVGSCFLTVGAVGPEPKKPVAKPPAVDVTQMNPTARAAAQRGVKSCLSRIDQISGFLGQAAETGVFLFNPAKDADKRLFSTSMEVLSQNSLAYVSASYAPGGTDGCGASYEAVTWWPSNCNDVAAKAFPALRFAAPLLRNVQVLEGDATLRVFLMPAGTGCVSIKKEVIF